MRNKLRKILSHSVVFVIGMCAAIVVTVYAATYSSSDVRYTNNGQSTVEGALDNLYTKSSKFVDPDNMGTPTNYIFDENRPTTSSPTTPPSGKKAYMGLYSDGQYGACIKLNGTQHCFRGANVVAEKKHMENVFSSSSCEMHSNSMNCSKDTSDGNYTCSIEYPNGKINCAYMTSDSRHQETCIISIANSYYGCDEFNGGNVDLEED